MLFPTSLLLLLLSAISATIASPAPIPATSVSSKGIFRSSSSKVVSTAISLKKASSTKKPVSVSSKKASIPVLSKTSIPALSKKSSTSISVSSKRPTTSISSKKTSAPVLSKKTSTTVSLKKTSVSISSKKTSTTVSLKKTSSTTLAQAASASTYQYKYRTPLEVSNAGHHQPAMGPNYPEDFFTQVFDPVTNTSSSCKVYQAHGYYPKTWTRCSVPTFEFKVVDLKFGWSLEFRRQYQGNGKLCEDTSSNDCIVVQAYISFNASSPGFTGSYGASGSVTEWYAGTEYANTTVRCTGKCA